MPLWGSQGTERVMPPPGNMVMGVSLQMTVEREMQFTAKGFKS